MLASHPPGVGPSIAGLFRRPGASAGVAELAALAGLRLVLQAMGCQLLGARSIGVSQWIAKCRRVRPCAPGLAVPTRG